jgi:hypothetical protein
LTVAVSFQFLFVENGVKQFALPFGEEKIHWLWTEATHQFKHDDAAAWSAPDNSIVKIVGR